MLLKTICFALLLASVVNAQQDRPKPVMTSFRADRDVPLTTNPASSFWSKAGRAYAEVDPQGKLEPYYRTEVRSRWTETNLYFLFICPYKQLYLKSKPDVQHETFELWNWNVAEVFLG